MSLDIKEILKSFIGTNSEDYTNSNDTRDVGVNSNDLESYTDAIVSTSIISKTKTNKHYYVSVERENSLNSIDLNKFTYVLNAYPVSIRKGTLNVFKSVENLTSMRLTNLYITIRTPVTQFLLKNKRINILINELASQSFINNNGNRFHFEAEYINTINNIARFSTYEFNRGLFEFNQIIKYLDTLTFTVYINNELFQMEANVFNIGVASYGATTLLTLPFGVPSATSPELPYIYSPTSVLLSGFSTTTPVVDVLIINSINTSHTTYTSLKQAAQIFTLTGTIQVFVDNKIYTLYYAVPSAAPNFMQVDLTSVDLNVTPNVITSIYTNLYQVGTVVSNNFNSGYLSVTTGINLNVFTITITTTDGLINSQLVRTYAGAFTSTLNSVPLLNYIILPIDTSTVSITTPSIVMTIPAAKLEFQLEFITEDTGTGNESKENLDVYDIVQSYKLTPKQLAYIVSTVQTNLYSDEQLNEIIKQTLSKKINIKALANNYDVKKIQKIIHQPWLYKINYLSLSFDDALIEDNVKGLDFYGNMVAASYKWFYSITRSKSPNTVTTINELSNIVGLHLAPISIATTALSTTTVYNYTILIDEFSSQSFSTSGRKYHFTADCSLVNDIAISNWSGVKLDTTNYNRGRYWFHTPFKTTQSFTFTFALSSPITSYVPIPLESAPVYFIPGRETIIFLPYNPPFYTVDYFFFVNFTTKTPVIDDPVIKNFNRIDGYSTTRYPTTASKLRVVPSLNTSTLNNLSQYLFYTDQVWDGITNALVNDGAFLNSQFTIMYDNPVRIRTSLPHGISTGTTVFITDFISQTIYSYYGDAAFEASMNSLAGHVVTVLDANTFTIPLDGTVISYKAVLYYLYQTAFVPDYTDYLLLTTAKLNNITINPVISMEVITMKE